MTTLEKEVVAGVDLTDRTQGFLDTSHHSFTAHMMS